VLRLVDEINEDKIGAVSGEAAPFDYFKNYYLFL